MLISINPGEYYPILRLLTDPLYVSPSGTFYVQATIKRISDETTITLDTVNLADEGGGRTFKYRYQVPVDTSGQGYYISITTKVYTDVAYTIQDAVYQEESQTLLVQQRWNVSLGGGGGGADVDYKRIKKMIDEAIANIVFPEMPKFPHIKIPKPDLSGIEEIKTKIDALPRSEKLDLTPVLKTIKAIPQPEAIDLSPITEKIDGLLPKYEESLIASKKVVDDMLERVKKFYTKDIEEIKKILEVNSREIEEFLNETPMLPLLSRKEIKNKNNENSKPNRDYLFAK